VKKSTYRNFAGFFCFLVTFPKIEAIIPEFPSLTLLATGFFVIFLVSIAFRQRIKQGRKK
jgi:hypothetical protein